MNHYTDALKNYANFKGRTGLKSFWMFFLINFVISFVISFVGGLIGFEFLGYIYSLALLLPTLAIGARRMHDVGKSGWFYLIPFYNLYLAIQPSEPVANQWGNPPVES